MSTVRVLVVDDQPLVRAGLRRILETDDRISVVGEAEDGQRAVEQTQALSPDVVLMDIRMPVVDGIQATQRITGLDLAAHVVMLTTFGLDELVIASLRAGASGFVLKEAPPEEIVEAVHVVAGGSALISPAVTRAVLDEIHRRPPRRELAGRLEELTPREREVLLLVARGLSNAEIASVLVVGEGTVKTHVAHVLAKLRVRDRVQAVIYAYEAGFA
ncbi:MAG: response regulator [Gaiellaceae bacterium]